MAHRSDNARRLEIRDADGSADGLTPNAGEPEVVVLVLPFEPDAATHRSEALRQLQALADRLHVDSILCILTGPEAAVRIAGALEKRLHLQLWVAVKLQEPRASGPGRLPEHHAALLVLTKSASPLRHTRTRVGYCYCPACDRTTKDYGGKKHTYHEYGTLLSDVWRDLAWQPGVFPVAVLERLADLFGLPPYRTLRVHDHSGAACVRPTTSARPLEAPALVPSTNPVTRLIHGDCLDELRRLPDDSIDFCFADPPYNLSKNYDRWDDGLALDAYEGWCGRWLDELARVLKPGRTCAVLNIPQRAIRHGVDLQRTLRFQNWIAWEGLSLPVRRIMPAHYAIVCYTKGPPRPLRDAGLTTLREGFCLRPRCARERGADRQPLTDLWWDVHRLKHNARRVDHPCQLPPTLMARLLGLFTEPGETVLDPFDGAGTTSLVAAQLGRGALGIELSGPYHALSRARHALLQQGGDPFARQQATPSAKNSRVKRLARTSYEVPKKTLQLEVRTIARQLGRLPTRAEVGQRSQYPLRYFDEYFLNWGEVCAAARTTGMSETRR